MTSTGHPRVWAKLLVVIGSIGLLLGALDPLEGSLLIFLGSGLAALGTFLGHAEPRLIRYRAVVFILIALGVAAMWGLTAKGGFGGKSGLSMWWGLLLLPYLIGYPLAITGPGNPRWFLCLGIGVSLWYLALCRMVLRPTDQSALILGIVLAVIGLTTLGGCIIRLLSATRYSRAIGHPTPT